MASTRSARINSDPDKYIRTIKGGKFQARPFDLSKRYDLGTFHTRAQARVAILKFWKGELTAKPRFTRKIYAREGIYYIAVVCLPDKAGGKRTIRVGGMGRTGARFLTATAAQGAAIEFLDAVVGPEMRAAMMVRG